MLQTIYTIPEQVGGLRLFGAGLLLALCAVGTAVLLYWVGRRHGLSAETLSHLPIPLLIGAVIWFVLPKIAAPYHGLPIRGYGVMFFLGVVAGAVVSAWRGYRVGLDPDRVITLVLWGIIPGIIAARLFYVVEYWSDFEKETLSETLWEIVNITQGGLVVYGSLAGGVAGFIAFAIREKWPVWATLDLVAPGMLLGLTLGRIGCFLNGCCFGGPCELPWAVSFPFGTPPHVRQVEEGRLFLHGLKIVGSGNGPTVAAVEPGSPAEQRGLRPGQTIRAINGMRVTTVREAEIALLNVHRPGSPVEVATADGPASARWLVAGPLPGSLPTHPTQLYSAIDALLLGLFLLAYDPFRRRDGELIALALTIYPISRFLMEFVRTDEPAVFGTILTIGQVASVIIFAAAMGLWYVLLHRPTGKAFPADSASTSLGKTELPR